MHKIFAAAIMAASLLGATQADAFFFGEGNASKPAVKHTRPMNYSKPPASFEGQHFTNAYGCTYSRTQAPGYPMVWFLQVNTRANGCPNEIPG